MFIHPWCYRSKINGGCICTVFKRTTDQLFPKFCHVSLFTVQYKLYCIFFHSWPLPIYASFEYYHYPPLKQCFNSYCQSTYLYSFTSFGWTRLNMPGPISYTVEIKLSRELQPKRNPHQIQMLQDNKTRSKKVYHLHPSSKSQQNFNLFRFFL